MYKSKPYKLHPHLEAIAENMEYSPEWVLLTSIAFFKTVCIEHPEVSAHLKVVIRCSKGCSIISSNIYITLYHSIIYDNWGLGGVAVRVLTSNL